MRPDLNANTSSSNLEIQRRYEQQRNNPAAPPEPAHVPAPVPQMRVRSPQRIDLGIDDESQADAHTDTESDSPDTHTGKRQREEAPGELEQIKPAKTRRIEAEPEAEACMQLVSRDEALSAAAVAKTSVRQQLNEAIVAADLAAVKRILAEGQLDLNAPDENHSTPLMLAVKKGHLAIVEALLNNAGVTVDAKGEDNWTALFFAAWKGYAAIVETLLAKGANPHTVDEDGQTPLMLAAKYGHADVVNSLLSAGVEIDQIKEDNWTALFFAADAGYVAIVEILLSKGASLHIVADEDRTPLMLAAENGHADVVNLLLNAGVAIDAKDMSAWTALFFAAREGNVTIVEALLCKGADPLADATDGRTPLMLAAFNGHADVVNLLLNVGVAIEAMDHQQQTALLYAAQKGQDAILQILLDKGANLHAVDDEGKNALMIAAVYGHDKLVKRLLDAGIEVNRTDAQNWTALLFAAKEEHAAFIQALLDQGAGLDQMSINGDTALILATENQHIDIVRLLLNNGASVNLCSGQHINATEIAIKAGDLALLEVLLSHGGQAYGTQNPTVPLVAHLLRHPGLVKPEIPIEALAPDLQTGLQSLFAFNVLQTADANTVIRQTLENAGLCSPIVQQLMQYVGDVPALWQTLAGTGRVASAAQKSLSIVGAFAQLDAWVKNWPEGYDPYQGQGLIETTAARSTVLLKLQVEQLVAIAHDKEALTLAAGLNNLLPLCVQHTQGDAQRGFHVNQPDLIEYLHQELGLYGLLADQVATAWSNTLADQQASLMALLRAKADKQSAQDMVSELNEFDLDLDLLSTNPDHWAEASWNQTLYTMLNDPELADTVEQSLLPAFGRQLKLMDAANGHSLLRTTQTESINADAYADLMYRQLHMLSQYWTQANAGALS